MKAGEGSVKLGKQVRSQQADSHFRAVHFSVFRGCEGAIELILEGSPTDGEKLFKAYNACGSWEPQPLPNAPRRMPFNLRESSECACARARAPASQREGISEHTNASTDALSPPSPAEPFLSVSLSPPHLHAVFSPSNTSPLAFQWAIGRAQTLHLPPLVSVSSPRW